MRSWIAGTAVGAVALTLLMSACFLVLPLTLPAGSPHAPWWALASNLVTVSVLAAIAVRSTWTGWRLAAGIFAVLIVVQPFTSLIEAAFFDFFADRATVLGLLFRQALVTAAFAPVLVALVGRWPHGAGPVAPLAAPPHAGRRVLACSALYLVLYFVFGAAIYPFIREFYAQKSVPGPLAIAAMQLLVRGPLFCAALLLVANMVPAGRRTHAVLGALVMSVVGGVAPLMAPNPYFPDAVRAVHLIEVTVENFIFGWVAGWVLSPAVRQATTRAPAPVVSSPPA